MGVAFGVSDFFSHEKLEQGHGRDVGRLAAHVVQEFMQDWLTRRWAEVKDNPAEAFRTLFREVRRSFHRPFLRLLVVRSIVFFSSVQHTLSCFFFFLLSCVR